MKQREEIPSARPLILGILFFTAIYLGGVIWLITHSAR